MVFSFIIYTDVKVLGVLCLICLLMQNSDFIHLFQTLDYQVLPHKVCGTLGGHFTVQISPKLDNFIIIKSNKDRNLNNKKQDILMLTPIFRLLTFLMKYNWESMRGKFNLIKSALSHCIFQGIFRLSSNGKRFWEIYFRRFESSVHVRSHYRV